MTARVSVLIPAYNCAATIGEALRSVLEQQGAEALEVIVVDDGSTDGTLEALAPWQDRVRVLRQANRGPAAARNRALAAAQGEYIAFLDADDLWLPGKLAAQLEYLARHRELKVVYGRWERWLPDGSVVPVDDYASSDGEIHTAASGWIYTGMLLDSMIHSITAMVHREVIDAVGGFDESLRTGEDYDFWLRVTRRFRVAKLARTLARYRIHPHSATAAEQRENNEYRVLVRALQQYGDSDAEGRRVDRRQLERRLARLCFGHGYRHYWRGDARVAYESFRLALRHFDFRPRTLAYCIGAGARCAGRKLSSILSGG